MRTLAIGPWTWALRLDIDAMERCAAAGADLSEILSGKSNLLLRLRGDPMLVARVLWAICEPQAIAAQVAAEQFRAALTPQILAEAKSLLRDEIIDFFSEFDPEAAKPLRRWVEASRKIEAKIGNLIAQAPERSSGTPLTDAPESSESPPAG